MRGAAVLFLILISSPGEAKLPADWGIEEPLCLPDWGRVCDPNNPAGCFDDDDPAKIQDILRQPFSFKHKNSKSDYVMICAHGMTESPFHMKDIALCAADVGIDVSSIALAGHTGTDPKTMASASRDRWVRDMKCAIQQVKKAGKKPILCGSSTGGVLATRMAMEFDIDNMLLFQPAVKLTKAPDYYINSPTVQTLGGKLNIKGNGNGIKLSYESIHPNVANALAITRRELDSIVEGYMDVDKKQSTNVFLYHSDGDLLIDAKKNRQFFKGLFDKVTAVEAVGPSRGPITSFFNRMFAAARPRPPGDREIATKKRHPHGAFLSPPDARSGLVDKMVDKSFHHQNFGALCEQIQKHLRATVPGLPGAPQPPSAPPPVAPRAASAQRAE